MRNQAGWNFLYQLVISYPLLVVFSLAGQCYTFTSSTENGVRQLLLFRVDLFGTHLPVVVFDDPDGIRAIVCLEVI